jgi:SAM-dependent methyltransferase
LHGFLKKAALRLFGKEIAQLLSHERILANPYVAAKRVLPLEGDRGYYVIPNLNGRPAGVPVPPADLREGVGLNDDEVYLASGREHAGNMLRILGEAGAGAPDRVLEFGCAAGRLLRHVPARERWGVDLKAGSVEWCRRHLSPPMNFVTTTTFPHLPFEDNYFDLAFAGSVFTHISDLPDAWFLELRRVVRPGGHIYLTVHDRHTLELLRTTYRDRADLAEFVAAFDRFAAETGVLESDWGMFSFDAGRWGGFPVPQVFHDVEYLRRRWGGFTELVSVNEEAYGWQTGLLFRK